MDEIRGFVHVWQGQFLWLVLVGILTNCFLEQARQWPHRALLDASGNCFGCSSNMHSMRSRYVPYSGRGVSYKDLKSYTQIAFICCFHLLAFLKLVFIDSDVIHILAILRHDFAWCFVTEFSSPGVCLLCSRYSAHDIQRYVPKNDCLWAYTSGVAHKMWLLHLEKEHLIALSVRSIDFNKNVVFVFARAFRGSDVQIKNLFTRGCPFQN